MPIIRSVPDPYPQWKYYPVWRPRPEWVPALIAAVGGLREEIELERPALVREGDHGVQVSLRGDVDPDPDVGGVRIDLHLPGVHAILAVHHLDGVAGSHQVICLEGDRVPEQHPGGEHAGLEARSLEPNVLDDGPVPKDQSERLHSTPR